MPKRELAAVIRRAPRPEGTDGSDHAFRMIVQNTYKRRALLKKYIRILFFCQVPMMFLLGIWSTVPMVFKEPYPLKMLALLGFQFLTIIAFYFAAFGTRKERIVFVKIYGILVAILTAEYMLIRFWYHVMTPKIELYPHLLGQYLGVLYMENTDVLRMALTVWEALLDTSLFIVYLSSTFCCRAYVAEIGMPGINASEHVSAIKED